MLMQTMVSALSQKLRQLHDNGVKFRLCGQRQGAPGPVLVAFDQAVEYTRNNTGLILNIAFNYGGRQEIMDAVTAIAGKTANGALLPENINEQTFADHLYTAGLPDPDLLIRTSGEIRISNFLLWQLSYAEFYFTDKCWPEFTPAEFDKALAEFARRERRFGDIAAKGERT